MEYLQKSYIPNFGADLQIPDCSGDTGAIVTMRRIYHGDGDWRYERQYVLSGIADSGVHSHVSNH